MDDLGAALPHLIKVLQRCSERSQALRTESSGPLVLAEFDLALEQIKAALDPVDAGGRTLIASVRKMLAV